MQLRFDCCGFGFYEAGVPTSWALGASFARSRNGVHRTFFQSFEQEQVLVLFFFSPFFLKTGLFCPKYTNQSNASVLLHPCASARLIVFASCMLVAIAIAVTHLRKHAVLLMPWARVQRLSVWWDPSSGSVP